MNQFCMLLLLLLLLAFDLYASGSEFTFLSFHLDRFNKLPFPRLQVFSGCGRPRLPGRKRRDAASPHTNADANAAPVHVDALDTNSASSGPVYNAAPPRPQADDKPPSADDDPNESFDEYPYKDFKYRGGRDFVRPTTAAGTSLDRLVRDIKSKVKQAYGLWGNLSSTICDKENVAASSAEENTCWNGNGIGRYVA